MIKYHGGPVTPQKAAIAAWRDGHAMISFARPDQLLLALEYCASVALDNGAFTFWRRKSGKVDYCGYLAWVLQVKGHPAFDWCLIPDIIDGSEEENNRWIDEWPLPADISVPVWHLHESLEKLAWLCDEFPRVAIGSSGEFAKIGTKRWWIRIEEAMAVCCDADGYPLVKLHGLRQMDNEVTSLIPYHSVDSCNIARNIGKDVKWKGTYIPKSKAVRALVLRDRIAHHAVAARWPGYSRRNQELLG